MSESPFALAYAESVRAITTQASGVDSLRARAATTLAAAALVTSFLGGQSATQEGFDGWTYVALALLGGVLAGTLLVLWPYGWQFSQDAADLVAIYDEGEVSYAAAQRDLALHLDTSLNANERRLRLLAWSFRASAALLILEAIVWLIDLRS